MDDICTWDEVFTRKREAPNLIFLTLYWYLFNKPDYQSSIAKNLRKLKDERGFKDIPDSITKERNITTYIHEMEEYNLVGIRETRGKRDYYQALSFFYLDPFCVKTPELRSKTIDQHYEEYKNRIKELGIAVHNKKSMYSVASFSISRSNAVIPAQEVIKDYSLNPEGFLAFFFQGKRNYIALNDLIRKSFSGIDSLFYRFERGERNTANSELLDIEKALKIFDNNMLSLLKKYHFIEWYEGFELTDSIDLAQLDEKGIKYYWTVFCEHVGTAVSDAAARVMLIYTDFEFGRITFNKKKMKFEGEFTFITEQ